MKPIILDVDTGVDDALAIAYAVHSPELNLLGVTTCFGNIPVTDASRNSLAVLEALGVDVPVIQGASETLVRGEKQRYSRHVHGQNGIGNVELAQPTKSIVPDKHAVDYMIEQIYKRPHELTIVAVGPLTNLALAIQKDANIAPLIKEIIIMGGAVNVPGNVTPYGEANIVADPEAAGVVFSSGANVVLVGLDVTLQTLLPRAEIKKWQQSGEQATALLGKMTDFYIGAYEQLYPGIGGCALHDPLAIGVAINPSFVTTKRMEITVVTEGEKTGQTMGLPSPSATVQVCVGVEHVAFVQHFLERIR